MTGWTSWTPAQINDDQIYAQVTHQKSGGADEVRLDWIPIEVTYQTAPASGHVDADLWILKSDGSVRTSIANKTAQADLTTTPTTLQGNYSWSTYNVVSQGDYLAVDYYVDVTSAGTANANLRIDDNTLSNSSQTSITNVILPTQYTASVGFTGPSDASNWANLIWSVDSSATTSGVSMTLQLYNYTAGQYAANGNGYSALTIGTTNQTSTQTISANPSNFRNGTGWWNLEFTATKASASPFNVSLDLLRYSPGEVSYSLSLEEQWVNVDYSNPRQNLCIYAGNLASESLLVDVWHGGVWNTVVSTGLVAGWNNVSVTQYMDSSTFTIRLRDGNPGSDFVQSSWGIDAALLSLQPDLELLQSVQDAPIMIEFLQNGTMRWLGQSLTLTTQAKPIPPLPVKSILVNQTINGVNQEVPFQIEDWASQYQIPLGLTSNFTVFGNNQMIVFPVNANVSKVTVWWNGSDVAIQTPLAYASTSFASDNPNGGVLSNGRLTLTIANFYITSTIGSTYSTTYFMRINNDSSVYGANPAYVINHGVVRDIVQQEAEWNNGPSSAGATCPNVYSQIVITLPAGAAYFTYQARLMFINSTQPRTINDICPVQVTSSVTTQAMTENGISNLLPIVTNGPGTFYNTGGAAHHWSQFISGSQGAGIMFTNSANQQLYAFDSMAGTTTGALDVSNSISLLPVTQKGPVQFGNPLDITWYGAVATFDGSATPIYKIGTNGTPTGLWVLAEYQPTITVTADT